MLLILFKTGKESYALAGHHIVEIVPYLIPNELASQPDFIPGAINYRGAMVPVIDLGILLNNAPCRQRLSTRIILIKYSTTTIKEFPKIIGLLAEEVTESIKINTDDAAQIAMNGSENYGGKQYINANIVGHEMMQLFEPRKFLPTSTLDSLAL
jgi:chemotaxis signal transduction protein